MKFQITEFFTYLLISLCLSFSQVRAGVVEEYIKKYPEFGLVAEEINFEGIKIKNLKFDPQSVKQKEGSRVFDKYAILHPSDEILVHVDYKIDRNILTNLKLHHLIYGLYPNGPQNCMLHSFGLLNTESTTVFVLQAPEKKGVYQLRFCHAEGNADYEHVKEEWWKSDKATVRTTMAVLVVE